MLLCHDVILDTDLEVPRRLHCAAFSCLHWYSPPTQTCLKERESGRGNVGNVSTICLCHVELDSCARDIGAEYQIITLKNPARE